MSSQNISPDGIAAAKSNQDETSGSKGSAVAKR